MPVDPLAPLLEALAVAADRGTGRRPTRLGTVTAASGPALTVRFDGEENASGRPYPRLKTYTPAVGERVLLLAVGATYVAVGAVAT